MVIPISCNECRRRKIRCDRVHPCKNCSVRGVQCTYPAKFRSIDLYKLTTAVTQPGQPQNGQPQSVNQAYGTPHIAPPSQQQLPHQPQHVQRFDPLGLMSPIQPPQQLQSQGTSTNTAAQMNPSMATPLAAQDQYQSSNNEALVKKLDYYEQRTRELELKLQVSEDLISVFDSTGTSDTNHFGASSILSLEYSLLGNPVRKSFIPAAISNDNGKLPGFAELTKSNSDNKSIRNDSVDMKRPLPVLIQAHDGANMNLLNSLVRKFFDPTQFSYFNDLFDESSVSWFLNNHSKLETWSHDDDMMVLLSILIDSLKSTLFHPETSMLKDPKLTMKALVNYYFQISKTQKTESLKFMKSQVILINYFSYVSEGEKAWKMLFSTVSNAYAHGIHIVQGPLWMKISFMEALLCSSYSRPNLIHGLTKINITQEEDPYREYELMNIMRDRNMAFIETTVNSAPLKYEQMLQIDVRFENINNLLNSLLIRAPLGNSRADQNKNHSQREKLYLLLLISVNERLKLHHSYFEKDRFSDLKTMELISLCTTTMVNFYSGRMDKIRDMFTGLECHIYQFLLIFIKYLNFQMVNSPSQPSLNTYEIKTSSKTRDTVLANLQICKDQILKLFDSSGVTSKNILNAIEIIRSMDIMKNYQNKDSLVSVKKTGELGNEIHYYANDTVKFALEGHSTNLGALGPEFAFD